MDNNSESKDNANSDEDILQKTLKSRVSLPPLPPHNSPRQKAPRLPPRITNEDLNILQFFTALRPKGPVARGLANVYLALSQVGNKTVIDYCRNSLNYTNRQIKAMFTTKEQHLLGGYWDPYQQDITLLYKLLQHVCGLASCSDLAWTMDSHSTEYLLHKIKGQRNYLAHEATTMTDEDFLARMKDLEISLRAIMDQVSARANKNMEAAVQEMEQGLQGLLDAIPATLTISDFRKRKEEMKTILNEQVRFFKANIRQPLTRSYERFLRVSSISWEKMENLGLNVNDTFVPPDIESSDGEKIPLEKLLPSHRSQWLQLHVLRGIPGVGKTYLCQYIVYCWIKNHKYILGLQDVEILVFIQCAYVYSESFTDYLMCDLLQNNLDVPREDIFSLLKKLQVLVLIDGWDESRPSIKSMIGQLLRKLPEARFIFTVRPELASEVAMDISPYISSSSVIWKHFDILGFSAKKRKEYFLKLSRLLNNHLGDQKVRNSANMLNDWTRAEVYAGELMKVPLALTAIVNLCSDCYPKSLTKFTREKLYRCILGNVTQKLVQRLKHRSSDIKNLNKLKENIREWLLALGKEAWTTLKSFSAILSEESIKTLKAKCQNLDMDETDMLSSFLRCSPGHQGVEDDIWNFEHNVMQQFLAAHYLFWKVVEEDDLLSVLEFRGETVEKCTYLRYLLTLTFLAATLCQKGKMTDRLARDFVYLFDVPDIRWEDIGQMIQECEKNDVIIKHTQPLLVNKIVAFVPGNLLEIVICTLQHTSLNIGTPFYVGLQPVNENLCTLLLLLEKRCVLPVLLIEDDTDLSALQRVLEKGVYKFRLPNVIRMSLTSPTQARSLASCLLLSQNSDESAVHLPCDDKVCLVNILAFIECLRPLDVIQSKFAIELPITPWCDMNLVDELQPIFCSCTWPGTLTFHTKGVLVSKLIPAAAQILTDSEVNVHRLEYTILNDSLYENGSGEHVVVYDENVDRMNCLMKRCRNVDVLDPNRNCGVCITASLKQGKTALQKENEKAVTRRDNRSFRLIGSFIRRLQNK